jgi:hypothetical protein
MDRQGLPTDSAAVEVESRLAKWMVAAGSTVSAAAEIAYLVTPFLRR